jgi:trk system potassium uptake protein TrkH
MAKWPSLAFVAVILAMAMGGAVCSTSGGFKNLRIGVVLKAFVADIRKLMLPDRAIFVERFLLCDKNTF